MNFPYHRGGHKVFVTQKWFWIKGNCTEIDFAGEKTICHERHLHIKCQSKTVMSGQDWHECRKFEERVYNDCLEKDNEGY